jgi:hypothetical protein
VGRSIGIVLALAAGVALAGPVGASCPPFTPPPVLAGASSVSELADQFRAQTRSPLIVTPPSGPAPLEIEVRWHLYPYGHVERFDFDFDGDGRIDWSGPSRDGHYPQPSHTFRRPGRYTTTVHVAGTAGTVPIVLRQPVEVFAPDVFDRELKDRWNTMREALRRRDIPGALDCIVSTERENYERVFRELFAVRTTGVDGVLPSITLREHRPGAALYELVRVEDGVPIVFDVRFTIDADGVWRVDSF